MQNGRNVGLTNPESGNTRQSGRQFEGVASCTWLCGGAAPKQTSPPHEQTGREDLGEETSRPWRAHLHRLNRRVESGSGAKKKRDGRLHRVAAAGF